jgi:predicted TPR repeat methyltransferase
MFTTGNTMPTLMQSSGDQIADRRADYAKMLDESGDPAAAADLMGQALELFPRWAGGWFTLGQYREKAGDILGAIAALRQALALDPADMFGAGLKLAVLGAETVPDQPPSRYVESLFDDYADRFETALVQKLGYAAPKKLAALLYRTLAPDTRFRCAVDLGCGTGLLGEEFVSRTDRLEGFDLAAKMLVHAAHKHIYAHLAQADFSLNADASGLFSSELPKHRADLVGAADVMIYLGNLENAFQLVCALIAPGGIFVFSVEDSGEPTGFRLAPSLRYLHSQAYTQALLGRFGFSVRAMEKTAIRMDAGKPLSGILFVAEKIR